MSKKIWGKLPCKIATSVKREMHSIYGSCPATITHVDTGMLNREGVITVNNMARCTISYQGKLIEVEIRLGALCRGKEIAESVSEFLTDLSEEELPEFHHHLAFST